MLVLYFSISRLRGSGSLIRCSSNTPPIGFAVHRYPGRREHVSRNVMQPQLTSSRPAHNYVQFYKDCASYPELPKFRRLAAQWTKTLYDDLDEVLKAERRLNDAIAESRTRAGAHPLTFLECPRSILKDKVVLRQWHKYKQLLRAYCRCYDDGASLDVQRSS
jgi:hypothetical protein